MSTIRNQYCNFWYKKKNVNTKILLFSLFRWHAAGYEIDLSFWADRQIDTGVRNFFMTQEVSKRKNLIKIMKVIFHMKPIPSHWWWECKNCLYKNMTVMWELMGGSWPQTNYIKSFLLNPHRNLLFLLNVAKSFETLV